jgi:hypothetical protein
LIRAAKYLGVPPWELAEQPTYWQEWANDCQWIDNELEKERDRRQAKKGRRSGGSSTGPGGGQKYRIPLGV